MVFLVENNIFICNFTFYNNNVTLIEILVEPKNKIMTEFLVENYVLYKYVSSPFN